MVVTSSSVNVEVFASTNEYTIAAWRRILMLIWKGKGNAVGIEHSRRVFDEWVTDFKRGAVFLVVVPARHAEPPDAKTREAMREAAEYHSSAGLRGMGTLIQAEGFVAASIRSIIMRLNVLTGKGAPNLFETADKAAEWANQVLGDSEISGVNLASAIRVAQEGRDNAAAPENLRSSP